MKNATAFRKELRAAFETAATKLGVGAAADLTPDQVSEQLDLLMNDENWQNRFTGHTNELSPEEHDAYVKLFRSVFKKEILVVAAHQNAPAERIEAVAALPEVEEEPVADTPAAEVPAAAQASDEELTAEFYAVEFREKEAVAVPFSSVEKARSHARRRSQQDHIITQVATRQQYADRLTPGSMLAQINLMDKPYRIEEPQAVAKVIPLPVPAPEPAPAEVAAAAPAAKPKKTPAPAASTPAAVPASAPDAAGAKPAEALEPLPVKHLPLPADGAPLAEVFKAKLSRAGNVEQFEALVAEAAAAGHELRVKNRNKAVVLDHHFPSDKYEGGVNMRFRYLASPAGKVDCKGYLHCMATFFEFAPAK